MPDLPRRDNVRFFDTPEAAERAGLHGAFGFPILRGNTVLAVMAFALAAGSGLDEAMRLATVAAGIVVGKLGTAVVEPRQRC